MAERINQEFLRKQTSSDARGYLAFVYDIIYDQKACVSLLLGIIEKKSRSLDEEYVKRLTRLTSDAEAVLGRMRIQLEQIFPDQEVFISEEKKEESKPADLELQ